jgi:hypothetical protein
MTVREYKLAAGRFGLRDHSRRREILEIEDGVRRVVLVVDDADALDVLDVLRAAYEAGREDKAADTRIARGDVITSVPDKGPWRRVLVSHVERHLMTFSDLPGEQ